MPPHPASFGEREDESAHTWGGLAAAPLGSVDDGTLRRFHTTLLKPTFPPAELITFEQLRHARLQATTRGTILFDGADPVAGIVTEDYLRGRVLLVTYLVVAATARGGGIGARLLSEVTQRRAPTPLILAEIEDPRCFAASDAGDPVARVRFYDRIGSRLLPLPYAQPSLRPGSPRVDEMLLITIGAPGPDIDGALVTAFLDEYYSLCEGEDVVRTDPAYLAMRAAALGDEHSRLPLLPLSALEAARPHPAATALRAPNSTRKLLEES
ncbi:MAG: hypothetical protein ACRDRS_12930 [Pseudonocardiaceae bacterium]